VRDSSFFAGVGVGVAAARRVRSSSLSRGSLSREEEAVGVVVVPARPAALRVPWTDVLSILVNDLVGGVVAVVTRAADDGGLLVALASNDGREGAREGIYLI